LNVHHAAADGIGTLRFLRSILRAYNDQPDKTADIDALEARDLDQLYSASNLEEQTRRLTSFVSSMRAQMIEHSPIAASDGLDCTGCGCFHLTLEADEVAALNPKKYTRPPLMTCWWRPCTAHFKSGTSARGMTVKYLR